MSSIFRELPQLRFSRGSLTISGLLLVDRNFPTIPNCQSIKNKKNKKGLPLYSVHHIRSCARQAQSREHGTVRCLARRRKHTPNKKKKKERLQSHALSHETAACMTSDLLAFQSSGPGQRLGPRTHICQSFSAKGSQRGKKKAIGTALIGAVLITAEE